MDLSLFEREAAEPIARAVQATGMSDQEFDAFVEQARQEVWDERQRLLPPT